MARRIILLSSKRLICSPSISRFFSSLPSAVAATPAPESKKEKIRHIKKEIKLLPPMNIYDALPKLKSSLWASFDETIEMAVKTSLDPRKPNQSIKGVASLPHGNGKKVRIAVFATGSEAQSASEAGADIVGSDELIARVVAGDIPFDRVIGKDSIRCYVYHLSC
jgi:ribosomal protein L1